MRNINKFLLFAFLFLYLLVAAISFCHAIEFFSIGNNYWMSVTLAFAFELGLAVCLISILLGSNKNKTVSWILLTILVVVQVCGNTYSVFKYISESNTDYYNYLSKPLLFWIEEISKETSQIIVSWIMGAILPIVALFMTEMVASTINSNKVSQIEEKRPNLRREKDDNDDNEISFKEDIENENKSPLSESENSEDFLEQNRNSDKVYHPEKNLAELSNRR